MNKMNTIFSLFFLIYITPKVVYQLFVAKSVGICKQGIKFDKKCRDGIKCILEHLSFVDVREELIFILVCDENKKYVKKQLNNLMKNFFNYICY